MSVFLGIDIGGTNIKIATVSANGAVLARGILDTAPEEGPENAFARIKAAVPTLGGRRILAAGIGCAGLIDPGKGVLRSSPNLKGWENTALGRISRATLGVYTTIDNDATSAAYGEYRAGGHKGCRHLVFLTLGTGVGGGIISDGHVIRGADNYGGEIGHMVVAQGGRRCRCGTRGCLEAYAGAYGWASTARELLAERRSRYLTRWVAEERRKLSPRLIAEAARRGDAVAKTVIKRVGESLGTGIASLINLFNPQAVVVGGGAAASFDLLLPHVRRVVERQAFPEAAATAKIELSALGNDATVIGAAMFVRDSQENRP